MKTKEQEREFLRELEALSRKHGLAVDGCGCCGSPGLRELEESELTPAAGYAECVGDRDFAWLSPASYHWDEAKDRMVK